MRLSVAARNLSMSISVAAEYFAQLGAMTCGKRLDRKSGSEKKNRAHSSKVLSRVDLLCCFTNCEEEENFESDRKR